MEVKTSATDPRDLSVPNPTSVNADSRQTLAVGFDSATIRAEQAVFGRQDVLLIVAFLHVGTNFSREWRWVVGFKRLYRGVPLTLCTADETDLHTLAM